MPFLAVIALAARAACFAPPVDVPIAEPFRAPPCEYCAGGHRGIEYDTDPGLVVRAVAPGAVSFAGSVAGTRYVTVQGDDGLTYTYGMLATFFVHTGDAVGAGQSVGETGGRFYFGMRAGDTYLDPQRFLAVVTNRPRLVPSSGGPARPPRPARPRCPAEASSFPIGWRDS